MGSHIELCCIFHILTSEQNILIYIETSYNVIVMYNRFKGSKQDNNICPQYILVSRKIVVTKQCLSNCLCK